MRLSSPQALTRDVPAGKLRQTSHERLRVTDAQLAAVQERVQHISSTLEDLKQQMGRIVDRVNDVSTIRELASQDRSAMARIERAVSSLGEQVGEQIAELRRDQEMRWERHDTDARGLRDSVSARFAAVDKRMNFAIGWVSGVGMLGALLVGTVVWVSDYRFSQISAEAAAIPTLRDKIHAIELHLARDRGQQYPTNGEKP